MQTNSNQKKISKFFSLVLRHKPDAIDLAIDAQGWALVDELIVQSKKAGFDLDREMVFQIVAENDKKRFSLSPDKQRIRAAQGHSVDIDLALSPIAPPNVLYHGTATRFLESIHLHGLLAGSRKHVHLSDNTDAALKVGQRHGKPTLISVDALMMHQKGFLFFRADNGVWLTDHVPVEFLIFS